jgi:hypothetical protein
MIPARRAFPYIRLSVLWHIGIFSLSLIIPATVLTVHFGSEVRALELQSSLTASARLLQRDTMGLEIKLPSLKRLFAQFRLLTYCKNKT